MKKQAEMDGKILISARDLNFIMDSLKSLNEKVDNLTAQLEKIILIAHCNQFLAEYKKAVNKLKRCTQQSSYSFAL